MLQPGPRPWLSARGMPGEENAARAVQNGGWVDADATDGVVRLGEDAVKVPERCRHALLSARADSAMADLLGPGKDQVPHAVTELDAAVLELGQRPVSRLRRVAFGRVLQQRLGAQHLEHLHRVVFPVGRAVQVAAGRQALGQQLDEGRLQQAALVVARLVPGIGEEDMHARQRARRDHLVQHLDRIVLDQAQVRELLLADLLEQAAHTGRMHFDADEILLRHALGDVRGGVAHAEADFKDDRRAAPEGLRKVERRLGVVDHELRPQFFERARLRDRQPSRAGDEAADAVFGRVVQHRAVRGIGGHGR